jgi:hypothetical protein
MVETSRSHSGALIMESESTTGTVTFSKTTQCNIPEDSHLQAVHCSQMKPLKTSYYFTVNAVKLSENSSRLSNELSKHAAQSLLR